MPALGSPVTWRQQHSCDRYLFLLAPSVVFKARVNQASFTYPLDEVLFDTVTVGASTDIRKEMLVLFGSTDGADDLGRQWVRKAATSNTLYIGRSSRDKERDGAVNLSDNAYITILELYTPRAKIPYIDDDTGTLYKDSDEPAGTYPTYPRPVANISPPAVADMLGSASYIEVTFSAADSFGPGSTVSHYFWELPSTASLQSGTLGNAYPGTTGSATITVRFTAGFGYVYLTVHDTHHEETCMVPVFVGDMGSNKPILDFEVQSQVLRPGGQDFTVRIYEDIAAATYPDGTLVLYFENEYYNGARNELAGPDGGETVKFYGWHHRTPTRITGGDKTTLRDTTLHCLDIAGKLRTMKGFPTRLDHSVSPSGWAEIKDANMDKFIIHILTEYTNAASLAHLTWSSTDYPFPEYELRGRTPYDMADQAAWSQGTGYRLVCDMRGQLAVRAYPNNQNTADRTSIEIVQLNPDDYAIVGYTEQRPPRRAWTYGAGLLAGTSAVQPMQGIAPAGGSPGQGNEAPTLNYILSADETELLARVGHEHARGDVRYSNFDIDLVHGGDAGIEPALMEWIDLTIDSDIAAQRGYTVTNGRYLPVQVTIRHLPNGIKSVRMQLEPETDGLPAQSIPIEIGEGTGGTGLGGFDWTPGPIIDDWDINPSDAELFKMFKGIADIGVFRADGYIYKTTDFQTPAASNGPTYTRTLLGVSGTVLAGAIDAYSPKYIGTGSAVNAWLVTTSGIYYVTDVGGTPSASPKVTFSETPSYAEIDASFGTQNFVLCGVYFDGTKTGTYVYWTSDNTTWTETLVDITTGAGAGKPGLYVSSKTPGLAYIGTMAPGGAGAPWSEANLGGDGFHANWTIMVGHPLYGTGCTGSYDAVNDRIDGCTPGTNQAVGSWVRVQVGAGTTITTIRADVDWNKTRWPGKDDPALVMYTGPTATGPWTAFYTYNVNATGVGFTSQTRTGLAISNEYLVIGGAVRNNSSSDGSYWRLVKLDVNGNGTDLFP